ARMERLMAAQGPPPHSATLGPWSHDIAARADGRVAAIDCHRIARIARLAGAPMDKGAGIDLRRKVGDSVAKGDILYRIHAQAQAGLAYARDLADEADGYTLTP
ncbi:MAG: hypothetical protein RIS17_1685, partial [Pseudomonadota bacterium]